MSRTGFTHYCGICGQRDLGAHQCPPLVQPQSWTEITPRQYAGQRLASIRCPACDVGDMHVVDQWGVVRLECGDCRHARVYRLVGWRRVTPLPTTRDGPPVTEADTRGT